jgi:peptidylprolyl isomerase
VGRANEADSGNAAELYVVTGHAPRHLDRNVTLLGRVIDGIEHLSSLPRGSGPLGFFENESEYVPIRTLRFASGEHPEWQMLRTDTDTFQALIASRRQRSEEWFVDPVNAIGLCNVPLPVRQVAVAAPSPLSTEPPDRGED